MENVAIRDKFIKLGQVLKLTGIAENGVIAKKMIQDGKAKVNGEVDLRRGRKVYSGDVVECKGQQFKVINKV